MATKTIKFLQGGGFVERQTNADTVEQLRNEFPDDITSGSSVAVNGVSVTNTHAIEEGTYNSEYDKFVPPNIELDENGDYIPPTE